MEKICSWEGTPKSMWCDELFTQFGGLCDRIKRKRIFNLTSYNFCMILRQSAWYFRKLLTGQQGNSRFDHTTGENVCGVGSRWRIHSLATVCNKKTSEAWAHVIALTRERESSLWPPITFASLLWFYGKTICVIRNLLTRRRDNSQFDVIGRWAKLSQQVEKMRTFVIT